MASKKKQASCGCGQGARPVRYTIDAVTSIDARGQVVIPKGIRDAMSWNAGDKLAIIIKEQNGRPCCVSIMSVDALSTPIKDILEPPEQASE
jgi:AbrB family looped-hinge helix DNA binding protein